MMLSLQNIVKDYANYRALDHVSIDVPKGKIFGLLGPNGAGKTSLIRIINQITAPDEGVVYFDSEILSPKHIEQIGYLPEERGLYKKMKVGEQMIYLAQLKGLNRIDAKKKLNYWFDKLNIADWWNKTIEDLSKGMQQKVQFVATVIHEPRLIILDEPFSGFDPVNAQIIQDEILELNHKGATIIYSTHRMETVEELCDNIALINKSRKILDGALYEIKSQYKNQTYTIEFLKSNVSIQSNESFELIETTENHDITRIKIKLKIPHTINDVLLSLIPHVQIHQVQEIIPTIHDIFIEKVTQTSIYEQN